MSKVSIDILLLFIYFINKNKKGIKEILKIMNLIKPFFHFKNLLNFPILAILYPAKNKGKYVNVLAIDKIFVKQSQ